MKYVIDTNIFNKLVDEIVTADELPRDGAFIATHVQRDELKRTQDSKRRSALLKKFSETISVVVPTDSLNLGVSQLGGAKLGEGVTYSAIKGQLDALNNNKANNVQDALIAEVASAKGHVLLTTDTHLTQVCHNLGIRVRYWSPRRI